MAKDKENKELQKKYLELQILNAQIKQIDEQLLLVDQQVAELQIMRNALNILSEKSVPFNSLIPVGKGVFVSGKISETKEVLVNVGADVFIKKPISEAKNLIENQLQELEKVTLELNNNLLLFSQRIQELEKELNQNIG
ncbi:MAG: prefoldin subunit alpha [Candidatus Nanoarchaeia archaeon]